MVHMTYEDAEAYAKWAGNASHRGGMGVCGARWFARKRFVWGDSFLPDGHAMANTFQGHFPDRNTQVDGYISTSPVKGFPRNGYGLYGMAGNVWEWTADWYRQIPISVVGLPMNQSAIRKVRPYGQFRSIRAWCSQTSS